MRFRSAAAAGRVLAPSSVASAAFGQWHVEHVRAWFEDGPVILDREGRRLGLAAGTAGSVARAQGAITARTPRAVACRHRDGSCSCRRTAQAGERGLRTISSCATLRTWPRAPNAVLRLPMYLSPGIPGLSASRSEEPRIGARRWMTRRREDTLGELQVASLSAEPKLMSAVGDDVSHLDEVAFA